jgi:hypothetical protein
MIDLEKEGKGRNHALPLTKQLTQETCAESISVHRKACPQKPLIGDDVNFKSNADCRLVRARCVHALSIKGRTIKERDFTDVRSGSDMSPLDVYGHSDGTRVVRAPLGALAPGIG